MLFFPALKYINGIPVSAFSSLCANGPRVRVAAPVGGSIFMTSAPRSEKRRPHRAPARSAKSSTLRPAKGPELSTFLMAVPP